MRQYDKIFVPVDHGETVPSNARRLTNTFYKPVSDMIVLTLQEIREVFKAGYEAGRDDLLIDLGTPQIGVTVPDCEDYLTSKGIKIP